MVEQERGHAGHGRGELARPDAARLRQRGGLEKPRQRGEVEAERRDVDHVRRARILAVVALRPGEVRERGCVLLEGTGVAGVHDHRLRPPDVPRIAQDAAGQRTDAGGRQARLLGAHLRLAAVAQLHEGAPGERVEHAGRTQHLVRGRVVGDAHEHQRCRCGRLGRRPGADRSGRRHLRHTVQSVRFHTVTS